MNKNIYEMDYQVDKKSQGAVMFETFAEALNMDTDNDTFKYILFNYDIDGGDEETCRPLFIYKKTGLKMYWYKAPLRSAFCNMQNLTSDYLKDIVEDCVKELSERDKEDYYNMIQYCKMNK